MREEILHGRQSTPADGHRESHLTLRFYGITRSRWKTDAFRIREFRQSDKIEASSLWIGCAERMCESCENLKRLT
jgi:hypothetical protein